MDTTFAPDVPSFHVVAHLLSVLPLPGVPPGQRCVATMRIDLVAAVRPQSPARRRSNLGAENPPRAPPFGGVSFGDPTDPPLQILINPDTPLTG